MTSSHKTESPGASKQRRRPTTQRRQVGSDEELRHGSWTPAEETGQAASSERQQQPVFNSPRQTGRLRLPPIDEI